MAPAGIAGGMLELGIGGVVDDHVAAPRSLFKRVRRHLAKIIPAVLSLSIKQLTDISVYPSMVFLMDGPSILELARTKLPFGKRHPMSTRRSLTLNCISIGAARTT
jgi:hypothetical protein